MPFKVKEMLTLKNPCSYSRYIFSSEITASSISKKKKEKKDANEPKSHPGDVYKYALHAHSHKVLTILIVSLCKGYI